MTPVRHIILESK